jgi:hypothetical protein
MVYFGCDAGGLLPGGYLQHDGSLGRLGKDEVDGPVFKFQGAVERAFHRRAGQKT